MRNMQTPECQVGYLGYHDNKKYIDLCQAETNLKKGTDFINLPKKIFHKQAKKILASCNNMYWA